MLGALFVEAGEGGADWCYDRSRRYIPAVSNRNARLVSCDRSCVIDPDSVAGLTGAMVLV